MLVLAHTNGAERPPTEPNAAAGAKDNQAFCEGEFLQVNVAEWHPASLFPFYFYRHFELASVWK